LAGPVGEAENDGAAGSTGGVEEIEVAVGAGEDESTGEAEVVGVTSACDIATLALRMSEAIARRADAPDFTLSSIRQKFPCMLDRLGIFRDLDLAPISYRRARELPFQSPSPR